ncbi:unnamed protein product [Dovyalis caffra]|uniref:Uncharacterized protein n=1 Tax=Dovyalis caffra TaxID=77055 RepID=A0AAV1S1J8_9ROSI|nr:unnamed protein product [Dovyalis caffra]
MASYPFLFRQLLPKNGRAHSHPVKVRIFMVGVIVGTTTMTGHLKILILGDLRLYSNQKYDANFVPLESFDHSLPPKSKPTLHSARNLSKQSLYPILYTDHN